VATLVRHLPTERSSRATDTCAQPARAGNHRFGMLRALRARAKAPYKSRFTMGTRRSLNHEGGPGPRALASTSGGVRRPVSGSRAASSSHAT
jgi:hypothetical protein